MNPKRSVAIIGTRGYPSFYGGFETAVRRLSPYLAGQGWDVTVYGRPESVSRNPDDADPRIHRVFTRGIERKSVSTLSYGFTSTIDARRRRPDVALVMNVANGYWLPLLGRAGIPTVVNVDGIEWDREKWSAFAKGIFRRGARMTAKHATRLIVDSHEIGRRWEQEFRRVGDFVPYGGDPVDPQIPIEPGLSHRGYTLVIARFVPENTIPQFLEAARLIAETQPVVLVGSSGYGGPLDDAARQLAASHTNVQWLGHVSNDARIASLWAHAGVYFHGHSVGGTNPALVQAMAAGAPIVARDTVYNREVLGSAGAFTAPQPRAIADAVLALMSDSPRQQELSVAAAERARIAYSWESVCAGYEASLVAAMNR